MRADPVLRPTAVSLFGRTGFPIFFYTGFASKPYDWDSTHVSEFSPAELLGWILGIASSAVYVFARVQNDYRFKNGVRRLVNRILGYHDGHEKRHALAQVREAISVRPAVGVVTLQERRNLLLSPMWCAPLA